MDDLLGKKKKLIDTSRSKLLRDTSKLNLKFSDAVIEVLDDLSIKDGLIQETSSNLSVVPKINNRIKALVKNSGYVKSLTLYSKNFKTIEELSKLLTLQLNSLSKSDIVFSKTQEKFLRDILGRLTSPDSISPVISEPVTRIVFQQISGGVRITDAKRIIRNAIAPDGGTGGIIQRYLSQLSTDSVYQYQGSVYKFLAQNNEMKSYNYVGSLKKTSRPQCVRWVLDFGGKIPFDILPAEISWARKYGSGYSVYAFPTVANFPIIRGGHHCEHEAIPSLT